MKRMFELLVILIKKRILKSPTWLSHSKVSFQGPTLGSHPMAPAHGPTQGSHPSVPVHGPTPGSRPKVPPQGLTTGSWVLGHIPGPWSHFSSMLQVRYQHSFILEITIESVNLIQMSKQKIIITMMENNQVFMKKSTYKNIQQKALHCKKQRIPIYLTRTVLRERQIP